MRIGHVCLIGFGGMGKQHFSILKEFDCDLITIVEPRISSLDLNDATQAILLKRLSDLDLPTVDYFIVATPVNTRLEIVKTIGSLGTPIFFEKPFAMSFDVAVTINSYLARPDTCFVGFPRRMSDGFLRLKGIIQTLGSKYYFRSTFAQDFRKYRPDYSETYYSSPDQGGGLFNDGLSHHFDLACFLNGNVHKMSYEATNLVLKTSLVDDLAVILLHFENGSMAMLDGNQFQLPNTDIASCISEVGTFSFDRINSIFTIEKSDKGQKSQATLPESWSDLLKRQLEAFFYVANTRREHLCSIDQALAQLEILRNSHRIF